MQKTKLQVTVSLELATLIEDELKETHMTKSSLISKLLNEYFKQKKTGGRKVISLNIEKK